MRCYLPFASQSMVCGLCCKHDSLQSLACSLIHDCIMHSCNQIYCTPPEDRGSGADRWTKGPSPRDSRNTVVMPEPNTGFLFPGDITGWDLTVFSQGITTKQRACPGQETYLWSPFIRRQLENLRCHAHRHPVTFPRLCHAETLKIS